MSGPQVHADTPDRAGKSRTPANLVRLCCLMQRSLLEKPR